MEVLSPGDRTWWCRSRWWRVPVVLVVTIVITTCGIFWIASVDRPRQRDAGASPAQRFADAAALVFSGSTP